MLGSRATGKSTLLAQQLPKAKVYDLLDSETFARLARRPKLLEEENADPGRVVAIDEIQKLPTILDEVHRLIAGKGMRFVLTGSSARKLRRGAANLLAGRAWETRLFPLTWAEIPNFDLVKYLNCGGLPQVYNSDEPVEELRSYADLYLREEVQAEALTRNISAFARFLDVIGLANGEEINYQSLASDCGVSPGTLQNYIQILDDTLIGFSLPGYTRTRKRKAIARAKHYRFDVGIAGAIARRGSIEQQSELFGKAFEHFLLQEIRAYLSYARLDLPMCYWRSLAQHEVDLVLGDELAIEIKSTNLVQDKHLRGLRALKQESVPKRHIVISLDPTRRRTADGIEIWPWAALLAELWGGNFLR